MTSQNAQIQALLHEIDEALSKASPRLPWVMSNDAAQQRQALEQARQYLSTLQQLEDDRPLPDLAAPPVTSGSQLPSESAQQVLQAVLQEMNYWRVNMLQPLRSEVDSLQHQRERLTQEIRQLEAQRQQYGLPRQNQQQLMEFLQSAMAQMQANLSAQVRQMNASTPSVQLPASIDQAALSPAERMAQMQQTQAQSDQLMLKLDSTLQIIFESLNRNVETYQESLEQGLNRMHSLGQQGEAMFAFLVNRLAQQLGREASSFLQSSSDWPQQSSLPGDQQPAPEFAVSDFLRHPPSETAASQSTSFTPPIPFNLSEEVLDIADLETEDSLSEVGQLAGLDVELNQLDLNALSADLEAAEPFDLFAGDQPLPPKLDQPSEAAITQSWQSNSSDLDSALDLLNQLSAEMKAGLSEMAPTSFAPSSDLTTTAELITDPDSLYNDDFYDNFFSPSPEDSAQNLAQDLSESAKSTSITDSAAVADLNQFAAEWFDGLADPATDATAMQVEQPLQAESTNSADQLESVLLRHSAPAATDITHLEADLAAQAVPEVETDAEAPIETIETIDRLTDLIPSSTEIDAGDAVNDAATAIQTPAETLFEEDPLLVVEAPNQPADLGMTVEVLESLGAAVTDSTPSLPADLSDDPEKKK